MLKWYQKAELAVTSSRIFQLFESEKGSTSKAIVNIQDKEGNTALIQACINGDRESLLYLLNNHADVNIQNEQGKTALIYACDNKDKYSTNILLQNGANPNIQDNTRHTPLMYACKRKDAELVKVLLENGASVEAADNNNINVITLLDFSEVGIMGNEQLKILDMLLQSNIKIPPKNIIRGLNTFQKICLYDNKTVDEIFKLTNEIAYLNQIPFALLIPFREDLDRKLQLQQKLMENRKIFIETILKNGITKDELHSLEPQKQQEFNNLLTKLDFKEYENIMGADRYLVPKRLNPYRKRALGNPGYHDKNPSEKKSFVDMVTSERKADSNKNKGDEKLR